jgi:hypothetical protein
VRATEKLSGKFNVALRTDFAQAQAPLAQHVPVVEKDPASLPEAGEEHGRRYAVPSAFIDEGWNTLPFPLSNPSGLMPSAFALHQMGRASD